jgi:hypothetical protein
MKVFDLWPLVFGLHPTNRVAKDRDQKPTAKDLHPSAFILHPSFVTINRIQQRA